MIKKLFLLVTVLVLSSALVGCSGSNKDKIVLNVLNYGEYIDMDLLDEFENKFDVKINYEIYPTPEDMYTKVKSGATNYDLIISSDYMIEKLYNEGLLIEFDMDLLPNYQSERFDPNLQALRDELFTNNQKYNVPYFFGTLGIMYNEAKPGVKELVETHEWAVFFDRSIVGNNISVGMYDSSRDAIAAAALYLGFSLNTTSDQEFQAMEQALTNMNYDMYGTDDLKRKVAEQNLDIALVYSGDFFDQLYGTMEDDLEITFNMHVPDVNNIWFDGMVIPATSRNVELAHAFINFMIDEENAFENAAYVGYCPTITTVFARLAADEDYAEIIEEYPYYPVRDVETFQGEVYRDLGPEIYQKMELLFQRSKS